MSELSLRVREADPEKSAMWRDLAAGGWFRLVAQRGEGQFGGPMPQGQIVEGRVLGIERCSSMLDGRDVWNAELAELARREGLIWASFEGAAEDFSGAYLGVVGVRGTATAEQRPESETSMACTICTICPSSHHVAADCVWRDP